jgi:selenide, water dikinase
MVVGDALILTKPLGTGTLFAADMRGKAHSQAVEGAIASMLQSNREAVTVLLKHRAHAATDITGFGLVGHALEMARASEVGVDLDLAAVPLLPGAADAASAGHLSTLHPENARANASIQGADNLTRDPRFLLLFDPQTAGGLLAAVPADRAEECRADMVAAGYASAAIVGRVVERTDVAKPLAIRS